MDLLHRRKIIESLPTTFRNTFEECGEGEEIQQPHVKMQQNNLLFSQHSSLLPVAVANMAPHRSKN